MFMSLPFNPHIISHHVLCHMSNLRNVYVAMSVLGIKGHCTVFFQMVRPYFRERTHSSSTCDAYLGTPYPSY